MIDQDGDPRAWAMKGVTYEYIFRIIGAKQDACNNVMAAMLQILLWRAGLPRESLCTGTATPSALTHDELPPFTSSGASGWTTRYPS